MARGICLSIGDGSPGSAVKVLWDEVEQGALPSYKLFCPCQTVPAVQDTQVWRESLSTEQCNMD